MTALAQDPRLSTLDGVLAASLRRSLALASLAGGHLLPTLAPTGCANGSAPCPTDPTYALSGSGSTCNTAVTGRTCHDLGDPTDPGTLRADDWDRICAAPPGAQVTLRRGRSDSVVWEVVIGVWRNVEHSCAHDLSVWLLPEETVTGTAVAPAPTYPDDSRVTEAPDITEVTGAAVATMYLPDYEATAVSIRWSAVASASPRLWHPVLDTLVAALTRAEMERALATLAP